MDTLSFIIFLSFFSIQLNLIENFYSFSLIRLSPKDFFCVKISLILFWVMYYSLYDFYMESIIPNNWFNAYAHNT